MSKIINEQSNNLDAAEKIITDEAYEQSSEDNLTVKIVRINELPSQAVDEIYQQLTALPFPTILDARMEFDGDKIIREIHVSSCLILPEKGWLMPWLTYF